MSIKYPLTGAPSLTIDEVYNAMQTDAVKGISATESKKRSLSFGLNAPQLKHQQSTVFMLIDQFKSPIVYLLCVAAGISMYFQDTLAAISIVIVVLVNALIGFFMELQARSSMRALRQMDVSFSRVIHGGKVSTIPSENIVPGDLLLLEAGDLVAADGRIVSCNHLQCDESAVTGESFPVTKNKVQLSGSVTIADQLNMVFKGTSVVNGNAKFIVTGIAEETELGKITGMVANAKSLATPLEQKISHLTKKLIWITLGMIGLFFISGIIEGHSWLLVFETSIALAVAAFPEGLPILATVALSYGMLLMARKNAIVKKLSAVETLGGVNVILTDKTGTLTENKIDVEQLSFPGEQLNIKIKKGVLTFNDGKNLEQKDSFERMVLIGILCNNAPMKQAAADEKAVGDPVEVALVVLAKATGLDIENTNKGYKRVGEFPFSSETKIMGTIHKNGDGFLVAAKGSVEDLLLKCSSLKQQGKVTNMNDLERKSILAESEEISAAGLRVLAFAFSEVDEHGKDFLKELVYVGMIGFLDPPRLNIKPAILACKKAGIKIVMITGDHPLTALNIAKRTGILTDEDKKVITGKELPNMEHMTKAWEDQIRTTAVFARTTPKQKLEIVTIYQKAGFIVAMTGDGVNDAPALKKADIGIAMGLRGTAVAKETASIVLKDDSFTSIAGAVAYGREIFQNIQRFVIYLVSCNLSEIFIVTILGFVASGSMLLPMQILFLNMVTDVFPALALGLGTGDKSVMLKPPRDPKQPLITNSNWITIFIYAFLITLSVLMAVFYCKYFISTDPQLINNIAFMTLAFSQLFHVFNMSSTHSSLFINEVTRNKFVWIAIILCVMLVFGGFAFAQSKVALGLVDLPFKIWEVSLLASVLPLLMVQCYKIIHQKFNFKPKPAEVLG